MSSLMLGQGTSSPGKRRRHFTGRWQGSVGIHEYFHIYLHSVTIAVLDEKDIECEISCKIKHFHEVPGWRNWQTQRTQNPPGFGPWGFDSPSRHQNNLHRMSSWMVGTSAQITVRNRRSGFRVH